MYALLLLLFLIADSIARDVEFCYANTDDPYLHMGTKTAYTFIGGSGSGIAPIPNCKPMQLWMIMKHDSCYPSAHQIETLFHLPQIRDQIIMNHETAHNGHMCDTDLDNLRSWWPDSNMRVAKEGDMTPRGINDMRLFARRLQSYFPEILRPDSADITLSNYVFHSSGDNAADTGMESFMEGMFHSKYTLRDPTMESGEDSLMKIYSNCSRSSEREETIAQNSFNERDKFLNSTDFTNVLQNVSRRTGFKYQLSAATVLMMYDMCRFEKAWVPNRLSFWCAVFSTEDLKIIEYAEDIMHYYGSGYGRQDKTPLGCFILHDMVHYFRNLETQDMKDIKPKGVFYFTHTMFMLAFLTALGIGKDDQMLLASNYKDMTKRQWRTTFLAPYSSNLIAVFYRCQDTQSPNKVMFYFQEKPLMLEGCQVGLCDWEYLKNKFQRVIDRCDPHDCQNKSAAASIQHTIITLLINLALILTWRTWNA